jgi:hypothetical protein
MNFGTYGNCYTLVSKPPLRSESLYFRSLLILTVFLNENTKDLQYLYCNLPTGAVTLLSLFHSSLFIMTYFYLLRGLMLHLNALSNTRAHTRAYTHTHTHTHTYTHELGRTPLDDGWARRRGLYLATQNTHKRQTSMSLA